MGARFIVTEFQGVPILQEAGAGGQGPLTSFYVQDTLYNYNVVATFDRPHHPHRMHTDQHRRAATREAARLNQWWEAELARG